jgi:hypothetical protein
MYFTHGVFNAVAVYHSRDIKNMLCSPFVPHGSTLQNIVPLPGLVHMYLFCKNQSVSTSCNVMWTSDSSSLNVTLLS